LATASKTSAPVLSAAIPTGAATATPMTGRTEHFPGLNHAAAIRALRLQHDDDEDFYGTLNLRPASKLALRSEGHALRLASASDLWYLGGGAFQPQTFGYTGRPANGSRSLANVWDVSADCQVTRSFSATLYYGHAWGKSVIARFIPRTQMGS